VRSSFSRIFCTTGDYAAVAQKPKAGRRLALAEPVAPRENARTITRGSGRHCHHAGCLKEVFAWKRI
jgi:hypothetical protein